MVVAQRRHFESGDQTPDWAPQNLLLSGGRVATKVVTESTDVFAPIASTNSGDPGDLAHIGAGPTPFPVKATSTANGSGTVIDHRTPRFAVEVLTGRADV
jgi:hypothetical protein